MSYVAPPRAPDELLRSDVPDWAVRVWVVIRSKQGSNGEAWHSYESYGDAAGKSYDVVRKAVSLLVSEGWLERRGRVAGGRGQRLRCLSGPDVAGAIPPGARGTVEAEPTGNGAHGGTAIPPGRSGHPTGTLVPPHRDAQATSPTPPSKEESEKEPVQESERGARARSGDQGNAPTLEAVLAWAGVEGIRDPVARSFFHHYDAQGWRTSGQFPRPIRDWRAKLRQWAEREKKYDQATPGTSDRHSAASVTDFLNGAPVRLLTPPDVPAAFPKTEPVPLPTSLNGSHV